MDELEKNFDRRGLKAYAETKINVKITASAWNVDFRGVKLNEMRSFGDYFITLKTPLPPLVLLPDIPTPMPVRESYVERELNPLIDLGLAFYTEFLLKSIKKDNLGYD